MPWPFGKSRRALPTQAELDNIARLDDMALAWWKSMRRAAGLPWEPPEFRPPMSLVRRDLRDLLEHIFTEQR